MPTTVVLESLTIHPAGSIDVLFSDHQGIQFPDVATLIAWATEPDKSVDFTKQLALGWLAARNPSLSNPQLLIDKNFIFDLSAPNPIRVQ